MLIHPIMPARRQRLWDQLGSRNASRTNAFPQAAEWGGLAAGTTTTKGESLFPRLETE